MRMAFPPAFSSSKDGILIDAVKVLRKAVSFFFFFDDSKNRWRASICVHGATVKKVHFVVRGNNFKEWVHR